MLSFALVISFEPVRKWNIADLNIEQNSLDIYAIVWHTYGIHSKSIGQFLE